MKKYVDKDGLQYFAEELTAKNKEIFAVKAEVGTPLVAATAAAMTDTSKIYVYTGSETGYTAGDWYYYDGSAWQSGGVYNSTAVQTDTSLSVSGMAADAKTVGDDLDALDGRLDTIEADYVTDSDLSDLEDVIAPTFSTSQAYGVGEYVMYQGALYRFTASHSAGAWNSAEVVEVDVGEELADLNSALTHATGNTFYDFVKNKYIATSGTTADITSPTNNSGYNYAVIDCVESDIFTITGKGGSSQRLYAFLGAESNGTRPVLSKSASSYTATDEVIIAPSDAKKLVVNVQNSYDYYICKGKVVKNSWSAIDDVHTDIDYLRTSNIAITGFGVTEGYYVSASPQGYGELVSNANAYATDYIPVSGKSVVEVEKAYVYGPRAIIAYDINKNALSPALATDS